MIYISVQKAVFDVSAEMQRLRQGNAGIGAVASFVGLVRDSNQVGDQSSDVAGLTLEHYPGMTEKALKRIAEQASERWQLQAVTIVHRIGELRPGEPIVLVMTASPHRHDAFDACQYVMDILKTEAPFWKKETLPDGAERWVESRKSDSDAAGRWEDDGF